jgi:riboflavin kinase/FMN adenylyltransferase
LNLSIPAINFSATIIPGHGRGKQLGFPTLNLKPLESLEMESGVYAVTVEWDGLSYFAVMHVGPRPTFEGAEPSVEVHVLDFDIKESPHDIMVQVVEFLRPVQKFDSPEALVRQIREDVVSARAIFEKKL